MANILVVIPSFYPATIYGGTIVSSYNTAKNLALLGHNVSVVTTNTNMYSRLDVECNKWIPMDGFRVKYFNETIIDKLSLPFIFSMWKYIRKADIIHVQAIFNTPIPVALFYSMLFNKIVILSPRGVMGDWILNQGKKGKRLWLKFLIKPFLKNVVWHATSLQEKLEIIRHFPRANVEIIPNGINIKAYEGNAWMNQKDYLLKYTKQNFFESQYVITSLGRIHKKKGFDILIEGFYKLNHSNKILLIGGEDEGELMKLMGLVKKLNLEDKVFFVGKVPSDSIKEFLIHSNVFALISHNENFGNVYAEALACGLPIVASVNTPWNDVVKAGCGDIVNVELNEVANALENWVKYDKNQISTNARGFVQQFSWEVMVQRFDQLINELLSKNLVQRK
jgi:glycosyltransferase involved in cell wall biosynthesis